MVNDHPLDAVLDIYLENIDVRPKTVKSYRSVIKEHIDYLKRRTIVYAERKDIVAYKRYLEKRPIKTSTIQGKLCVVRNFYKWIKLNRGHFHFDKRYAYDVAEGIKASRNKRRSTRNPLTLKQVQKLLFVAKEKTDTIRGMRNYAIVLLLLTAGLRVIEIRRAKKEDIRVLKETTVLFVHGKGRDDKGEFVKIAKPVKNAIDRYLEKRDDDHPYLFISHKHDSGKLSYDEVAKTLNPLFLDAGIVSKHQPLHALRHTCAALNLETGGSLKQTQRLLRHQSLETTMIYLSGTTRWDDDSEKRITTYILQEIQIMYNEVEKDCHFQEQKKI